MQNEMRDRLVELMEDIILSCKSSLCVDCEHLNVGYPHCMGVHFVDHLIENGVVCLPCKVGDTVYYLDGMTLVETKVHCISFGGRYSTYSQGQIHTYDSDKDNITVKIEQFGKTVFLTREEAEQKLKGGVDNGKV